MRTLKESLLSDIDTSLKNGELIILLNDILKSKTRIEFEKYCKDLKKTLDYDLGTNYDTTIIQAKNIRHGEYICISCEVIHDNQWSVHVNCEHFTLTMVWQYDVVIIYKNYDYLYDYVDIHSKGRYLKKNKFYTYVCDDTWNTFRTGIIDRYKSRK